MTTEEAYRVATTAKAGTRIGDATVLRKGVENNCFVLWLDTGGCISVPNAVAVLRREAPRPHLCMAYDAPRLAPEVCYPAGACCAGDPALVTPRAPARLDPEIVAIIERVAREGV